MNFSVFKISILRIVDTNNICEDDFTPVVDDGFIYAKVSYEKGAYVLEDNAAYYQTLLKNRSSQISVAINNQDIPIIREHILMRFKREKLNPMLASILYNELSQVCNLKQRQIAEVLEITQGAISNKKRLSTLPYFVQVKLIDETIKERHARAILQLKDSDDYQKLSKAALDKIVEEKLNVIETENLIFKYLGKPQVNHRTLNIRPISQEKGVIKPEAQIVVKHVNDEMVKTIEKINKFFPQLDVEFDIGSDKEDVVFLLKLKGTCEHE